MKVSDIMTSPVHVMGPEEPVSHARKLMLKHKISTVVVVDNDEMVGIVTKSDLGRRLAQAEPMWRRRPIDNVPVKMIMTEEPVTIYPEASVSQATAVMIDNDINNVPVVNNGRLLGIITRVDVVRRMSELPSDKKVGEIMTPDPIFVQQSATIQETVEIMRKNGFSQLPVFSGDKPVGGVSESILLDQILYNEDSMLPSRKLVKYIMDESWPMVAEDAPFSLLSNMLKYYPAVLVQRQGMVVGIITKADLLGVFNI